MSHAAETHRPEVDSTNLTRRTLPSTRLYPPRLHANLVQRASLIAQLSDDPERRLTVITAPAGYGKSTLATQVVARLALPTAWVRLEATDDSPRSFFDLVLAALQLIDRDLAAGTATLLTQEGSDAETIVQQLIADLSTAARLILISRTTPPLRLARLRTSGELLLVAQTDLQFTLEETLEYFHDSLDLDLTPSEVAVIHERTEGWVIGLQLVGSALRGRTREQTRQFIQEFVGSVELGDQYLWEEVLERQPEEVRDFLLRTAVLDRFNASLCDAVTQAGTSDELLRLCERNNLFILPLAGQGAWYRYHHLFADALREQLGRTVSEEEITALHRRAATWLEANGHFEDAIRHATAGRQWDHVIEMLEAVCAELFERDQIATLRHWLQGIPPDVLATSPRLAFWLAWAQ